MELHRHGRQVRTRAGSPAPLIAFLCVAACSSGCGGGGGGPSGTGGSGGASTITSLAPDSATAGGPALSLVVNGSGFDAGSRAAWNGSPRSTTFFSATQLTAAITAADIAVAGTAQIAVVDAAGRRSNQLAFTTDPPGTAASCLVSHAAYAPGATGRVDISFTFNASRQIVQFGQVGAGASYNYDVTYDAQGKITSIDTAAIAQPAQYSGAFITQLGGDPASPTYSWNLDGFAELDSLAYPASGSRAALTLDWGFDPTGAVSSQQLVPATGGSQDQWAVSGVSPVAPIQSPFMGTTPEHRFLYFYGLYGRAVPPELLVGPFLSTATFEAFSYATGQKKHSAYYDFVYTVDADGKVTKVVGYQTDGPTPVAGGTIELDYDCR